MPSWKKVIISGSNAELASLNAPSITGSLQGTASFAKSASTFYYELAYGDAEVVPPTRLPLTFIQTSSVELGGYTNAWYNGNLTYDWDINTLYSPYYRSSVTPGPGTVTFIGTASAALTAISASAASNSISASFAATASYFNAAVVTTGSGTDFSLYSTSPQAGNSGTRLPLSGSITFGYQAGYNSSASKYVNLLGYRAGYSTNDISYSNFLGHSAGSGADNADQSQFIGYRAGYLATGANNSVFIGYLAGQQQDSASYSTIIGNSSGRSGSWGALGNNNIILGTNISLPNGYANYANIGGVLFISGTYGTTSGNNLTGSQANGRIGIGIVNPSASLHIQNTSTNNSFLVEDSTNPDNTPFLIDNAGNVMIGTTSSKGEVTIAASGADGLVLDTDTSSTTNSSRIFLKNSGSGRDISLRNSGHALYIGHSATAGTTSGPYAMIISGSGVAIGNNYTISAGRGALLQVSGSVNIEEGFAYKQDAENVIRIAKGTNPVTATYTNTIAGASAAEGAAYLDQITAFGYNTLYQSSGSDQTAFGYEAGYQNSGSSSTLIGWSAGYGGKALNQTAVGHSAGYQNTGTQQTAVGLQAGYLNIGTLQTALGQQAGQSNSGSTQTAVGYAAGFQNTGSLQTAIGAQAGRDNKSTNQTAVGYEAGRLNSGSNQSAFGADAGYQNTGISQTALGVNAGYQNSGSYQTAVGQGAGGINSASYQTAVGLNAGYQNSGSTQTAVGNEAGRLNSAANQTSIGSDSGYQNSAINQTAVGSFAGYQNSGIYQTALGSSAGVNNAGSNQTAVGYQAGRSNSGSNNSNFGYQAGYYTTGVSINSQSAQSVFLGSSTFAGGGNRTNQIVIGYNASGIGSNSVVLGNDSITTTALKGNVGIGTISPSASLHATGSAIISGSMVIGSSSLGPNENTLTLGARDAVNEGGQLGLNAPGGTYTSASMIDVYQNRLRILRGTNASSDAEYVSVNLHSGQVAFTKYTGSGAFPGTAAGYLACDAGGNILTTAGVTASPGGTTTQLQYNNAGVLAGTSAITFDGTTLVATGSFTGSLVGTLTGTASFATTASYITASGVFGPYGANSVISSSFSVSAQNTADILIYVKNTTGQSITKGKVVRIIGSTGDNALIATASYESDGVSANTLGITNETIADQAFGYVITEGKLLGIDTDAWTAGQLLFLGAAGSITGSAPLAPLHAVRLGQVLRVQQNNGSMYVRIDNGYEINELHDVDDNTTTSSYGDLLVKSGSVWTNSKQLTGSYGLTGSLTINGSTSTDLVRITQIGSGNAFVVEDSTNPDTSPFVIDNVGNVGIGVLSPTSASLQVNGNVFATSFTGSLLGTASFATSASFASSASQAITSSYALTASYINSLQQNVTISGSLTVTDDFILLGSASIQYITSSQLNIADNLITVNTYSPSVRFGGIAVIDSSSAAPYDSGSLLFDSEQDEWIFIHKSPGASPITSSLLIMGPESYDSLGLEIHPTTNRIMKSLNDEHIGDSNITDTGTIVSINSNAEITGSLTVSGNLKSNGSTINSNALIQAGLLYLSNNF